MLVYNTNKGEVEYLVELDSVNGPIVVKLNYIQDTTPSNPQEKEVWYNTSDNKIYTYKNGQWTETGEATVGVWYYDTVNDKYYLWDGTSLEETELNIYEKIENKTDNFESTSLITYPSSKALSDGLQDTLDKSYKPNLFDLKINSEPMTQKGWCCISDTQPKRLAKADIPTAYEFLKEKYNGIDLESTGSPTNIINQSSYSSLDCDDTYLYATSTNWVARRTPLNNLPNFNWENLNIPVIPNAVWNSFCVGNNLILSIISNSKIGIYLKSNNTLYKEINTKDDWQNPVSFSKVIIDNQQIFFISYIDTNNNYVLAKIEDSITGNIETLTTSLNGGISSNVVYINDRTFIFCCTNKIYKTTDYFQTYSQVGTNNNGDYQRPCSLYKINNVIVASGEDGYTAGYKISYDNGNTWNDGSIFVNGSGIAPKGWCNGKELYVFVHVLSWNECFLYHTGDLINWERIGTFSYNVGHELVICADKINNNIFFQLGYTVYNIGFTKVIYTDTINGIDINYYKNGDWKICIAGQNNRSGGDTTDGKLQDVYDYLGYLNYWWIDTINEQITLQRNSNLWIMMYVGDDYEDSSLPSGNYLPYALKPLKYSNIVASTWVADNTYADYGYKCDITCNGVTSNSIAQVIFALIEADSGNYATVCQTSTNTVTIYSKVDTTITIPTILVQGV